MIERTDKNWMLLMRRASPCLPVLTPFLMDRGRIESFEIRQSGRGGSSITWTKSCLRASGVDIIQCFTAVVLGSLLQSSCANRTNAIVALEAIEGLLLRLVLLREGFDR